MKIAPSNVNLGCSSCAKNIDENFTSSYKMNPEAGLKLQKSSKVTSIVNPKRRTNSRIRGLF